MSLTVALKYNGIIYIGSDSLSVKYGKKYNISNNNNYRIIKVSGMNNMFISTNGKVIEHNIIRFLDLIPENIKTCNKIDMKFLVTEFVPKLFEEFDKRHILNKKDNEYSCDSNILIAHKDTLYEIANDGGVLQLDEYGAIGCGDEVALGSLLSTIDNDNPEERILLALKAGLENKTMVAYPLVITNTQTGEYKAYYE